MLVAQSCPTLCDPMGCRLPGSSVHGILQARIQEWVSISFSKTALGSPKGRYYFERLKSPRMVQLQVKKVTLGKVKEVKSLGSRSINCILLFLLPQSGAHGVQEGDLVYSQEEIQVSERFPVNSCES